MQSTPEPTAALSPPTVERRAFIWRAGAALSAALASATAAATAGTPARAHDPADAEARSSKDRLDRLSNRLAMLEDENAIRGLHRAYGRALNQRRYEDIVALFAVDSEVRFNGSVFAGKHRGVRRLYVEHFGRGFAEYAPEQVHVLLLGLPEQEEIFDVAPGQQHASARFHCLMQVQAAVPSGWPLVEMARQQGQGVVHWWERGVFENAYVKDAGTWKIKQLAYRALGRVDPAPPAAWMLG